MPTMARTLLMSVFLPVISVSSKNTRPLVGVSRRFTQRSSVDLPEPEGPRMTTTSPRRTSRFTPRSTSKSPKLLCKSSMRTTTSLLFTFISPLTGSTSVRA